MQVFNAKKNPLAETLVLLLFILYEKQKGEASLWKPYLDMMPETTFFCEWDEEVIRETQDQYLIEEANKIRRPSMYYLWTKIRDLVADYTPKIFNPQTPEMKNGKLKR